jgi:hypothetical protein
MVVRGGVRVPETHGADREEALGVFQTRARECAPAEKAMEYGASEKTSGLRLEAKPPPCQNTFEPARLGLVLDSN